MMNLLKAIGWFFFGLDAIALLFFLSWALSASDREGESAYATVFLLFTMLLLGVGGAGFVFSSKRGSVLGLWCPTIWLGIPPVISIAIRIGNSLIERGADELPVPHALHEPRPACSTAAG